MKILLKSQWLYLFLFLIEQLLSKIGYVPLIFKYKTLSAEINLGQGFNPNKMFDFRQIAIKNIKNKRLKLTLILSRIFTLKPWYVYNKIILNEPYKHLSREAIYISRNKLSINDYIVNERINDYDINKKFKYTGKKARQLPEEYEIEPQYYILCAKYTKEHDTIKTYYKNKRKINQKKLLEKSIKDCIKNGNYFTRINFNLLNPTLLEHLLNIKRYDLIYDICYKLEDIEEIKLFLSSAKLVELDKIQVLKKIKEKYK